MCRIDPLWFYNCIIHIIHLFLKMQIVWSSTWLHAAPLDFQEGGGDDFDGSVLWDLEMLDSLKCKSIFCKLMHRCQVHNEKWGESYCMLTCHFSRHFLWSSAHVVGCCVGWLVTCVCSGYAAESSQRPHASRRKVFLTPFGPVNSLELVCRSMARAFRMLEEEPWSKQMEFGILMDGQQQDGSGRIYIISRV